MLEELSVSELTYLELTAKHAPHELPGSAALVQRLVTELVEMRKDYESLEAQLEDVNDRLTEQETEHKDEIAKLVEEKTQLQSEIEDLLEDLDNANDVCELC